VWSSCLPYPLCVSWKFMHLPTSTNVPYVSNPAVETAGQALHEQCMSNSWIAQGNPGLQHCFFLTYTSLPPAANTPTLSSYSMHRTALEQRPTVATHLSVLTSHIFTVPSWDAVNTRSPESVRTQLTYTIGWLSELSFDSPFGISINNKQFTSHIMSVVEQTKIILNKNTGPSWPLSSSNSWVVCLSHTKTEWSSDPDTTFPLSELMARTVLQLKTEGTLHIITTSKEVDKPYMKFNKWERT